uniref:Homeobox protein Rhox5 n=1 Tax=Rattus norvegicus TaxID=10116 RepID=RHOX5_RAT|nr:RecName: Full=Homeobox protein Rhox5; AltName: Full=Homeobox protein Pem; AltName: Full=Placenta and embryonic expression protein; AltName: Full=Reproductive homeobox on chromosome X 5 [Rattus norvegicus]AAC52665.1 Pem [Rattus norvegicus]AAY58264.1 reproductive homeobox on X chromosome 5 [Rattus norvegicus]|eukprot:NP_071511.1 homeobox protein Rhox5 [Rattus norvegicus]
MEAQGSSHDISRLLCLGVKEDSEEQHGQYLGDVKAEAFFQAGEGRDEKGAQGQPGEGAVGTEGEGEELNGGEGHFGPGVPGPVGEGDKDGGTRASGMEEEQHEPVAEGTESVKSEDKQMPLRRPGSTQRRLAELERILLSSGSSSGGRSLIDGWISVCPECRNWFKIRRAAYRRNRRRRTPIPEHFRATSGCPACLGARWGVRCPFATPRF